MRVSDEQANKVIVGAHAFVEPTSAGEHYRDACLDLLDARATISAKDAEIERLRGGVDYEELAKAVESMAQHGSNGPNWDFGYSVARKHAAAMIREIAKDAALKREGGKP